MATAWISPTLPLSRHGGPKLGKHARRPFRMMAETRGTGSVGFLGCGNMAGACLSRLMEQGVLSPERTFASARSEASAKRLMAFGLPDQNLMHGPGSNQRLIEACDTIVLGVKPQMAASVLSDVSSAFNPSRHLLVSLVAGMSTQTQAKALGHPEARIVRAIPTMAAAIGESCTAMVAGKCATAEDLAEATQLLEYCGFVEVLPSEASLDAATACVLPTFPYLLIEAIADAAVLEGLPRATAQRLAANSVRSAAALSASDPEQHPGKLRNLAESPGGVTIRATRELERGRFRGSVFDAVAAATARSIELNKKQ